MQTSEAFVQHVRAGLLEPLKSEAQHDIIRLTEALWKLLEGFQAEGRGLMDDELDMAGACGLYCGACKSYGVECEGCGVQGGAPFWGECGIYRCCIEESGLEFCGECDEFPCELYLQTIEHSTFPPLEALEESISRRLVIGTEAWLEEQSLDSEELS